MKPQAKVSRVMREFKKGDLKSSSGQKVTNPKQAIAIGLSEAGISKKAKGGEMKESKAMMKKEVSFMKKKGAPKSMLKHEMAEMKGMKKGGNVKKMAMGGMGQMPITPRPPNPGPIINRLPTRGTGPNDGGPRNPGPMPLPTKPRVGPTNINKPAGGRGPLPQAINKPAGMAPSRAPLPQAINKPAGMAKGGLSAGHKSADGVARKGKTKGKEIVMKGSKGMKKGGYC